MLPRQNAGSVARPTTKSAKELRVKWQQKEFSALWGLGLRSGLGFGFEGLGFSV